MTTSFHITSRKHGQFEVLVDPEDLPLISKYRWHIHKSPGEMIYIKTNRPQPLRKLFGQKIAIHRLVMKAKPGEIIDHINGDTLDNRKENLRKCTIQQNAHNAKAKTNSKTGYKGVSICETRFQAHITHNRTWHYLGSFATPEDAARAYDTKALELFGEFAKLNFPSP